MSGSPSPSPRVLIAAFQGWSDAGDATTEVLQHLGSLLDAEVLHVIGSEGYVDFQVHRPKIVLDAAGNRSLEWPDTRLYGSVRRPGRRTESDAAESDAAVSDPAVSDAAVSDPAVSDPAVLGAAEEPDPASAVDAPAVETDSVVPAAERIRRIDGSPVTDLFLLAGVEPARDWQNFADEIVELVDVWGIDRVILLGSMFSDAPHSRPIVTTLTSESAELRAETGAKRSTYEGPAGVSSAIDIALTEAGIAPISLWAQVPHYVHSTPSPKATLALLDKLEELLDIVIPRGDLLAMANEWEANINRIAAADDDMMQYIRRLEESRDDELAAESTGDAIALEFEKFLEDGRNARHIDPWIDREPSTDEDSDEDPDGPASD